MQNLKQFYLQNIRVSYCMASENLEYSAYEPLS